MEFLGEAKAREIFVLKGKVSLEFIKNIQLIRLGTEKYSGLITGQKYVGKVEITQIDREARGVSTQGIRTCCQSLSKIFVYEARRVSAGRSVSCSLTSRSTRCRSICEQRMRADIQWPHVKEACNRAFGRPCVTTHATRSLQNDTQAIGCLILIGRKLLYIPSYPVPKDCPEVKKGSFRVLISPDQSIQDIDVGLWDLTSRYQDGDMEGIKGVPDIRDSFRARIAGPNPVAVLVVVCRSLLPQMPPASPLEDRGMAIPIEDRDRAIPERLRLCGNPGSLSETSSLTPHILLQVTSRKDHSARRTIGAGLELHWMGHRPVGGKEEKKSAHLEFFTQSSLTTVPDRAGHSKLDLYCLLSRLDPNESLVIKIDQHREQYHDSGLFYLSDPSSTLDLN
ncbi:hypothetical protein F2Q69_00049929 [Brassica cretica]|uniref:Uncharacterized protein n=1 Tax=Brassica cretica TaxID=69181 RepID=A0A8S9PKD8_BRACR|nr:hypothetical protein F2Q69_00049929 [Brassica cretica]